MKDEQHVITQEDVEEVKQHGRWLHGCVITFFGLIVLFVFLGDC
jgi:hypothetical protein